MKPKDIINKHKHGQFHGYQERYHTDGYLTIRGVAKNSEPIGYEEWHRAKQTNFHIR